MVTEFTPVVFASGLIIGGLLCLVGQMKVMTSIQSRVGLGIEYTASESDSVLSNRRIRPLEPEPIPGGPYLMLILIHSTPLALERRKSIRDTWLKQNSNEKKFVARFVIGIAHLNSLDLTKLALENKRYGDLLLLSDIIEPDSAETRINSGILSFNKSKKKSSKSRKLLKAFVWAQENVKYHYIFKCMDNTFARLDMIVDKLRERIKHKSDDDLLWGYFAGNIKASKNGDFGEENWFLCTHYLPFPMGGGYVISQGLVSMIETAKDDLQHYINDDIALGVWLSPYTGIDYQHDINFNTGRHSRGCNRAYVVTSEDTPHGIIERYTLLRTRGNLCKEEFNLTQPYHYNWTAPLHQCCTKI